MTVRFASPVLGVVVLAIAGGLAFAQATRPAASTGEDAAQFWSVQPVQRPVPPSVGKTAWVRNPIDAFVLAKLEEKGLSPAPEADRRTLIRRLYFDLLGLPPAPRDVSAFVADPSPDAYEKLVDRLLASPHYGEHWARHWLDVAHYADTHGFERDQRRDHAWPYRDYVIWALNSDERYDQFLREQIAGDVLTPNDPDAIIATGFLAAGPWDFVGNVEAQGDALHRAARAGDLDDMVTQVITSIVGLTINCARCHNHKLDPIAQRDYYRLVSVFAGVHRGDRDADTAEIVRHDQRKKDLEQQIHALTRGIDFLAATPVSLADIVAGGDGHGAAPRGRGLDITTGKLTPGQVAIVEHAPVNKLVKPESAYIDSISIPDGGPSGSTPAPISSTGLTATVPHTSGLTWDLIQPGPVQKQDASKLGDVDYAAPGHTMIGLHANKLITFDLAAIRAANPAFPAFRFHAVAGYGGLGKGSADFQVLIDGKLRSSAQAITHDRGGVDINVPIQPTDRFLSLIATDGGDTIAYDQVFFGDPQLVPDSAAAPLNAAQKAQIAQMRAEREAAEKSLKSLPKPTRVYAITSEKPLETHVLKRGDPESPEEAVTPGTIAWVASLSSDLGTDATPEGGRRAALARWITDERNPLTRRVIVNRLWHYHFGQGIVTTPSDFGHGGDRPSHPELLDWLADELLRRDWSLKSMHRLILTSSTYRQSSASNPAAVAIDAQDRLVWRVKPHRLEAETMRDAILAVSGSLDETAGGPGYTDFQYEEAYAPIYRYTTAAAEQPATWRRSVYRFVVRSTPQQFLTTLDCPNPSNLTPARIATTTSLQSLALLNDDFVLVQARRFADRVRRETGEADTDAQIQRAFQLAFGRAPAAEESRESVELIAKSNLFYLCRMLLNANEFAYVD